MNIASYNRMVAEANQPIPEDFYSYEEYFEAAEAYWGNFNDAESMYYEDGVDCSRDEAWGE